MLCWGSVCNIIVSIVSELLYNLNPVVEVDDKWDLLEKIGEGAWIGLVYAVTS